MENEDYEKRHGGYIIDEVLTYLLDVTKHAQNNMKSLSKLDDKVNAQRVVRELQEARNKLRLIMFSVQDLEVNLVQEGAYKKFFMVGAKK